MRFGADVRTQGLAVRLLSLRAGKPTCPYPPPPREVGRVGVGPLAEDTVEDQVDALEVIVEVEQGFELRIGELRGDVAVGLEVV